MASAAGTGHKGDFDVQLKLLLIGDGSVGKSSLLARYTEDTFSAQWISTIGIDFKTKLVELDGLRVRCQIWDTAGQERFRTLTSSYYRGAHGVLLVYDVTRPETFAHLNAWLSEIEMYSPSGGKHVVKLLVGNKSDLEADRAVSTKEGEEWARSKGMLFLESSAKSGEAVKSVFEEVVSKVLESPALLASAAPGPRAGVARLDAATPPVSGKAGAGGCCK
jgi:small GTP-binding protein